MRRKEIYTFISPLIDQIYQFSYMILPDELESEQLVIDATNGFIIKEKKWLSQFKLINDNEAKLRRLIFQKIIKHVFDLGSKRALHNKLIHNDIFFQLPVRNRAIMCLRYQMNYAPEQIEQFLGIARWEVIEGIHNSRFTLSNELNEALV